MLIGWFFMWNLHNFYRLCSRFGWKNSDGTNICRFGISVLAELNAIYIQFPTECNLKFRSGQGWPFSGMGRSCCGHMRMWRISYGAIRFCEPQTLSMCAICARTHRPCLGFGKRNGKRGLGIVWWYYSNICWKEIAVSRQYWVVAFTSVVDAFNGILESTGHSRQSTHKKIHNVVS